MPECTVVIGVGNVLLGDEGVGVHIVNRLKRLSLPKGVEIVECGTAGLRILNAMEEARKAIVVDAVRMGAPAGTIHHFSLGDSVTEDTSLRLTSLHELDLVAAIKIGRLVAACKLPEEIVVVGVEPEVLGTSMELSPPVRRAIPEAIDVILEELRRGSEDRWEARGRTREDFKKNGRSQGGCGGVIDSKFADRLLPLATTAIPRRISTKRGAGLCDLGRRPAVRAGPSVRHARRGLSGPRA